MKSHSGPTTLYVAAALPPDFATMTIEAKLRWLSTQPDPNDASVSLSSVYTAAHNAINDLHEVQDVLAGLVHTIKTDKLADAGKGTPAGAAADAFLEASDNFIVTFGNALKQDHDSLINTGKFGTNVVTLQSGSFQRKSASQDADQSSFAPIAVIKVILDSLLAQLPVLNQRNKFLASVGTTGELFGALLQAAQNFYDEWFDESLSSGKAGPVQASVLLKTRTPNLPLNNHQQPSMLASSGVGDDHQASPFTKSGLKLVGSV